MKSLNESLVSLLAAGGGGNGGGGNGGGGNGGGGGGRGDLYGDQYVLLRDLDPTDGGGNGEAVLDANGQLILVGVDGNPIYFVQNTDGDWEIPADQLLNVQTVELERANVARAPDKVMDKSLAAAMSKIDNATVVDTDAAGRIVCDGVTIDSPLENLALYKYLMTAGGDSSWPDVVAHWPTALKLLVGSDPLNPSWDPSSLLGAGFSKEATITFDAVLYENTTLGVNSVTQVGGANVVNYFSFNDGTIETYNYDRVARYEDVMIQWYENIDEDPELEVRTDTVLNAVFGGNNWVDEYLALGSNPDAFEVSSAGLSGANDFAQATDDARAVINFMHEFGAVEVVGVQQSMSAEGFGLGAS